MVNGICNGNMATLQANVTSLITSSLKRESKRTGPNSEKQNAKRHKADSGKDGDSCQSMENETLGVELANEARCNEVHVENNKGHFCPQEAGKDKVTDEHEDSACQDQCNSLLSNQEHLQIASSANEATSDFSDGSVDENDQIAISTYSNSLLLHSIAPVECCVDEEDEAETTDFDPFLFIKSLPPLNKVVSPFRPYILPKRTRRSSSLKTLVLDLDETLVHSSLEEVANPDFSFPVHFNGAEHMVHVRQRPHLHTFMKRVASLFEVVVFTASQKIYAEKLLNILDPEKCLVRYRIYRDSCVVVDGNYLKDLSILGRDLAHTLIIDNSPQAFGFQVDNGVPIESWYDDDSDLELLSILPFLEGLVNVDDVRPVIQGKFGLRKLIDNLS